MGTKRRVKKICLGPYNTFNSVRSIQAGAGEIISGAFRTSSGAALRIDLFLQPVNLRNYIHSSTTPSSGLSQVQHTTPTQLSNCHHKQNKQHFTRLSPLHKLELRFTAIYHQNLKTLERRIPFPPSPWYKNPFRQHQRKRIIAIATHNSLTAENDYLAIYTDGSRIYGASAGTIFSLRSSGSQLTLEF